MTAPVLALAALLGAVPFRVSLESDGSAFLALPDSLWASPSGILAFSGEDTLDAAPAVRAGRSGVMLEPSPEAGDTVIVSGTRMQLSVPSSFRLDLSPTDGDTSSGADALLLASPEPYSREGLYISGTKRIGLSVGSGGGLDQGTRITLQGSAAPGITVSGSVTDQDLGGASSSELVSQLDRVMLSVTAERWRARLGDMEWSSGRAEHGPFSFRRELSGMELSVDPAAGATALAGYGTTGDTDRRAVFYTDEGVQGPYEVTSGWEVVPGSERVWLDGRLLQRGASADYEMEYAAGLLTFTPRRLVREDQRVEVTFLQRGDGFRSELVTVSGSLAAGPATVSVTGLSAGDRRDAPLGFILTPEAEEAIRDAGEDPAEAWLDGAEEVGEGEGSYDRDSLGHYVYRGPGQGSWTVHFGRPPESPGDYLYDSSLGGYAWVGEGQGTHLPRRYVQIPTSYSTGGTSMDLLLGDLEAGLDVALSRRVGNLFAREGTTREGLLASGSLSMRFREGGPGIGLIGRAVTGGYAAPSALEGDSSLAAWSLPPSYEGNDELAGAWVGGRALLVRADARLPESGGSMERLRVTSAGELGAFGFMLRGSGVDRRGVPVVRDGTKRSLGADLSLGLGRLTPSAGGSWSDESWADSVSGRELSGYAGLSLQEGGLLAGTRLELARDGREGTPGGPRSVFRARLEASGSPGGMRLGGSVEHSATDWDSGGSLQADAVSVSASGTMGGLWLQAVYGGSGTVSRSVDIIYEYVGEGEGSYSYDQESGQYYPDPEGDYEVLYVPGSEQGIVTEAELDITLSGSWDGGGMVGSGTLSAAGEDRLRVLLLLDGFDTGLEGGYDLELAPWLSWDDGLLRRLSVSARRADERTGYSGAGITRERRWSLEVEPRLLPLPRLTLSTSAGASRTRTSLYTPRDVVTLRLAVDPELDLAAAPDPGLLLSLESRRDRESGLRAVMYGAAPHLSFSGGGWTASARVSMTWAEGGEDFPVWFLDGMQDGLSLRTSARVGRRLASGLEVALTHWGRSYGPEGWSQRTGLEGTVTF